MTVRARTMTLADAARPALHPRLWDTALIAGFGTAMALFARLTIPLPFVPITGQTLGLLLTGALLGSRRGALAMLVYLAEGIAGLPVFAGGASAWSITPYGPVIAGTSAGYLWSYPLAAAAIGFLAERGWDRTFWRSALAMLAGEAVVYAVALPWLAHFPFIGARNAIRFGLLPFIPGDTVKLLLAAAVLPSGWSVLAAFDRAGRRGP
jgi:biotin transport system substrate-specific component